MRAAIAAISLFLLGGAGTPARAQDAGMIPSWEVKEISVKIEEQAAAVRKILENVRPKEWIQDGAPTGYVDQYEAVEKDLDNVVLSAQALGRKPEKLSLAVDTFLWLDRVYSMLRSMSAGVRRYQSPAVADLLDSAAGRNAASVEDLKQYMRELAVETEERLGIADEEAQRCRSELMNRPQ